MKPSSLRAPFDSSRPDLRPGVPFTADASFDALLAAMPGLAPLREALAVRTGNDSFAGQTAIESAPSAYQDHGYGNLIYALVRMLRPRACVELGVLHGFSLLVTAAALRDNGAGNVAGFDLFEAYPYTHSRIETVTRRIEACGLAEWARVAQADAFDAHNGFDAIDFLHVDISNDGEKVRRLFAQWAPKVKQAILLEGGSPDRDRVPWMTAYGKEPMHPVVEAIRDTRPEWAVHVLEPFPSMTLMVKNGLAYRGARP